MKSIEFVSWCTEINTFSISGGYQSAIRMVFNEIKRVMGYDEYLCFDGTYVRLNNGEIIGYIKFYEVF